MSTQQLLYKPDWEETKERFLAWWNGEAIGRCALAVTAPKKDARDDLPPLPKAESVEEQWFDLDLVSERAERGLSRTYFGGEAIPIWSAGYPGIASIPSFLGCPYILDLHTGWHDPILTGEDIDYESLSIDTGCREYRYAFDVLRRGVEEAKGKALVSIGAFGGCGDTLAALRETQQLLFDCIERPEQVRAAEDFLMDQWCEVFDSFYEVIREADDGSTCWFALWSPGKFYSAHNDFSYNISPKMFREIFLPVIERQTEFLDHTVYHVDGINAFTHVDALCDLPRLQALQILPGAGKPSPIHYMDVLKKVQAAGKNLHISIPISEVEAALSELSATGLFIQTSARTEDEARDLLKKAELWSTDR